MNTIISMERTTNSGAGSKAGLTALQAKKKLGFIEGTLTKPKLMEADDPSEFNAWNMVNSLVCCWIINIVGAILYASMVYAEKSKAMWDDLERWYAIANALKTSQLKPMIAPCKKGVQGG